MIYDAVVEDIQDPLRLGRVRVRVFGLHTDNTSLIKTEDLPWSIVLMPANSASVSGIGDSPTGIQAGSWVKIIFQDAEQQYPIILGTFNGIPTEKNSIAKSIDEISFNSYGIDTDDNIKTKKGIDNSSENSSPIINKNNPDDLTGMPTSPPPGTPNFSAADSNIKLIIDECLRRGIKSRRAIASILAIIGGESMWVPVKGNYNYSAKRLVEVFPSVFPTIESAKPYEKRSDLLPEKLYGVGTQKGKILGNTEIGDGSLFIDRGFVQLIGRYNYQRYANRTGKNILSNPELLISSVSTSVVVSVDYFIDRVNVSQYSDDYFEEAKKEVGNNTPDIATKKRKFYDYFMGGEVPVTENTPNDVIEQKPEEFDILESNSSLVYGSSSGFRDQSGEFPRYLDEQDTNRLARGEKLEKTIVQVKNKNRVKGIDSVGKTWEEQQSPYNSSYPNNRVLETKSGHVMEFDDTPNSERIHIYHKSGSYIEIDNTGSRTTRIVGSSYEIIDKNGHLFINGSCHVTIGGNANINVGGDLNARISGDANIGVGGSSNIHARGINLESDGDIDIKATGRIAIDGNTIHLNDGIANSSGVDTPSFKRPSVINDPIPNRLTDNKAVLYETESDKGGDALISEGVRNGSINPDEASRDPVEGSNSTVTGENKTPLPAQCAQIASMSSFPDSLRLSPNFTLGNVSTRAAVSSASVREQNGLSKEEIVCNLQFLCLNVLEHIKVKYPNMIVTSGFRYVGSNPKSQHINGQAVDIQFKGISKDQYFDIAKDLVASIPLFDQFLLEYSVAANNPWIHISCTRTGNRRQVMTFNNHKKYKDGLVDLS